MHKSSAFSLVIPPHQLSQQATNSAFKPISTASVSSSSNTEAEMPIKIQANKAKPHLKSLNAFGGVKSGDTTSKANIENSTSSQSSWSSSSSSTSYSSASKSPPKVRQPPTSAPTSSISVLTNNESTYKKPCLISPRKVVQAGTDLKIHVQNQQGEFEATSSSFQTGNMCGYLWQSRDSSGGIKSTSSSSLSQLKLAAMNQQGGDPAEPRQFEKFWFSLNASLCCLIYWHEKYEQDLGKFPVGKYELAKCCQVLKNGGASADLTDDTEFKLNLHQGALSLTLKATSLEKKLGWCEALKHAIENLASLCNKCKPKLIVNPMPLTSQMHMTSQVPMLGSPPPPPPPQQQPPSSAHMSPNTSGNAAFYQQEPPASTDSIFVSDLLPHYD